MPDQQIVYINVSNRPGTIGTIGDNQLSAKIHAMTTGHINPRRRFEIKGGIRWMDLESAENTEREVSSSSA